MQQWIVISIILREIVFQVNMLFFLSIIRTLVAKLKAPDMHGNEINHHRWEKIAHSAFSGTKHNGKYNDCNYCERKVIGRILFGTVRVTETTHSSLKKQLYMIEI